MRFFYEAVMICLYLIPVPKNKTNLFLCGYDGDVSMYVPLVKLILAGSKINVEWDPENLALIQALREILLASAILTTFLSRVFYFHPPTIVNHTHVHYTCACPLQVCWIYPPTTLHCLR